MSAQKPSNNHSIANEQTAGWTLDDISYELPPELIAQEPLAIRHKSRLLVVDRNSNTIQHKHFEDLPELLRSGDVLVVNNTRVIPARLIAQRKSGGQIKLLLLKPEATNSALWQALVTPIKRLKVGEKLSVSSRSGKVYEITIQDFVLGPDGFKRLLVNLGDQKDVFTLLNEIGHAPLPPYIHRDYTSSLEGQETDSESSNQQTGDLDRYQTVFAKEPGAVAAPTAGLHLSKDVMEQLRKKGVKICEITLHVGAGTFKPISDSVGGHVIEPETYAIPEETAAIINQARSEGRRIIAVGTTSLRTLETAGADQIPLQAVLNGVTSLYVKPGHSFRVVNALITNFHLSQSSLLVLVATFAGKELIMKAYQEAIREKYRFFSYGDAMLIL